MVILYWLSFHCQVEKPCLKNGVNAIVVVIKPLSSVETSADIMYLLMSL